ncbi:hypothetical protein C8J56DRAFT_37075 [Mycena floridula]|nr:hypothetical protein C8J56DRAFT_37075 [Mycena floridula]
MSRPQLFAPELLDAIIDWLSDDPKSLLACSLAGRALLPRSRHHLFSTIAIPRRSKLNQPIGYKASDHRSLTSFLAILDSPQSTIGPTVKHLELSALFWYDQNLPDDFSRIKARLCNVSTIRWSHDKWYFAPESFTDLLWSFPLVSIELHRSAFRDNADFVEFLCTMPETVQRLGLAALSHPWDAKMLPDPEDLAAEGMEIQSSALHFTILDDSTVIGLKSAFRWLLSQPVELSAAAFGFSGGRETLETVQWLGDIVQRLHPKKIVYTIPEKGSLFTETSSSSANDPAALEPDYTIHRLSHCHDLTQLAIHNINLGASHVIHVPHWYSQDMYTATVLQTIVDEILLSVPPSSLVHELEIGINIDAKTRDGDRLTSLSRFGWNTISSRLAISLPMLRRLRLVISGLLKDHGEEEISKVLVKSGLFGLHPDAVLEIVNKSKE